MDRIIAKQLLSQLKETPTLPNLRFEDILGFGKSAAVYKVFDIEADEYRSIV